MAKPKYDREKLHALAKRKNIQFSLEVKSKMQYQAMLKQIKDIGNVKLAEYHPEIKFDSQYEPWGGGLKQRAKWIKKKVNRCYKDGVPELGWRLAVETEIFFRFEVEVICRQCRRRLWQEDWKNAFESKALPRGKSIKPLIGQKDCKCENKHRDDRCEQGLSELFGYSVESIVKYEEEEIKEVHQCHQKPDGMYWLYRAGRMEKLLNAESTTRGKKVGDIVRSRPSGSSASNMAFPFLLFEAKSAKSANNFDDIYLQSCFAIREMLKIQHDLFFNRESRKYGDARPFVWLISSHGHMLNVSGAYFHRKNTQIVLLWSGNIAETENALRLLLIVDYICDWARKHYRANVIEHLLRFTYNPTSSLRDETEVFSISDNSSLVRRVDDYVLGRHQEPEENFLHLSKKEVNIAQMLELLDSEDIAIRDVNYRHFRVCALQINADNIDDFFMFESTQEAVQARARSLMKCFKSPDAWRVTIGALKALERFWVGCHIDQTEPGDKEEPFLARFGIFSYIECRPHSRNDKKWRPGNWLQVHELNIVAISEDAIAGLTNRSGYKSGRYKIQLPHCPKAPESCLLRYFGQVKGASGRDCITAAMQQRSMVSISIYQTSGELEATHWCYAPGMALCCDNDKLYVIQAPRSIYNRHRIGRKEPSETFTWISPRQLESTEQKVSPIQDIKYPVFDSYVPEDDGAVLVTNDAGSCCVFLVESNASRTISLSQTYSISTLAAGVVLKQMSLIEPEERDLSSFKTRMHSFLNNIIDLIGPNPGRRRSSTSQLASSSSFLEKITSYVEEDASTTRDSAVQTLVTSFEQKAREYDVYKVLCGLMEVFEKRPENEDFEHSSVISESSGDYLSDDDETQSTEDESAENESAEDESTEDDDTPEEAERGSDDSDDTSGASQNGERSAVEVRKGKSRKLLPYRFYSRAKGPKKRQT